MNNDAGASGLSQPFTLTIDPVGVAEVETLARLYQFYMYDGSGWNREDVDDDGRFSLPTDLAAYATDPTKSAALIRIDKHLAGFLLTEVLEIETGPIDEYADLFILRRYRRQGVALEVVRRTLAEQPRCRLLCINRDDLAAQAFWRRAFATLPFRSVTEFDDPEVPFLLSYRVNEACAPGIRLAQ